MNQAFSYPDATKFILEASEALSMKVEVLEKRHGSLLKLIRQNETVIINSTYLNPNTASSSRLAQDKAYSYMILEHIGMPIPTWNYFFLPDSFPRRGYSHGKDQSDAKKYLSSMELPVIIKPNSGSEGQGITRIQNFKELDSSVSYLREKVPGETIFIIQQEVFGREYRIVVLDGHLELCYEKQFSTIVGDGQSTINQLIEAKNELLRRQHDRAFDIQDLQNSGFLLTLEKEGLSLDSVIARNREITLNDLITNLAGGGVSVDDTAKVHPQLKEKCLKIADSLSLKYVGIDLRCNDITSPKPEWYILEVNSNPILTHYARDNDRQRVLAIYRKLLTMIWE